MYLPLKLIKKLLWEVKGSILSMFGTLKLNLGNIASIFLETFELEILQLVEKSINELMIVFSIRINWKLFKVFVQDILIEGKNHSLSLPVKKY